MHEVHLNKSMSLILSKSVTNQREQKHFIKTGWGYKQQVMVLISISWNDVENLKTNFANLKGNKMPKRVLWIDTETTGLSPYKNALTEVAAIMEIDDKEVDKIYLPINPFTYHKDVEIDPKALELTSKSEELLKTYPNSYNQFMDFIEFISQHFQEGEKIQIAGYNVNFDIKFIQEWFRDNALMPYFYEFKKYFSYKEIDTFALVKQMRYLGFIDTKDDKLGTLCEHFGIELDAHKAMDDIRATKELQKRLVSAFMGRNPNFDYSIALQLSEKGAGRMDMAEDTPSYVLLRAISLLMINIIDTEEVSLQELVQNVVDDIKTIQES